MTAEHRRQTAKPGKTGKPKKTGKPRKTGKPEKYERGTRSYTMSHIRGKDTSIERMVRSFLFAKGLRFRKNDKRYPGHPDVVLPKYRTIIFVNGCFWHMHEGCPKATRVPKSNVEFWTAKLLRNHERDARQRAELEADGWKVIVVWECELGKKVRDERLERLYREIVDDSVKGGHRGMTVGRRRCTKRGKNRNMENVENGAQPQLSKRAQIANPFRAMVFGAMADEMIANGTDVVKLSLGEPDFGAPPAVRDAMREQYDGRPLPYTAAMGLPELRQAISDFYKERHHVDVDPKRIAITAGGSTALLLSAALTVNDDDEVLIADPSYPCNRELVRAFGGKVVDVPTSAATRFHLTPELCKEYWTDRTKAVMITSPSNPTGTTIAFDTLKAVCDLARERGAWRIVDETYLDLADREPDGSDVKSVLACDPDAIVCSSFSKFFGMTGWRLGWMVVPEYALEAMDDLATNFFLCAHTPTQHAALACFTPETLAVCEERRQELLERRRIVVDGLAEIGLPLEVEPNGAFYAYFNISSTGLDAWTFCERALKEAHIALTPGRDFGEATADTHVRLSYAASREALREGLNRLGDFVAKVRG